MRVGDLSEEELLAVITPLLPRGPQTPVGTGDDCAVLSFPDARTAVSTDVLVEGHHFRTEWSTGRDVGARAAAQNLADAAAMGARPVALVIGLVMPPTTPVAWVRDFAQGLVQGCEPCGAGVVGGDLSGGESLVVAVTVLGDLEGRAPVLRSGARPGDLVVHAGTLGRSAAGLALLSAGPRVMAGLERAEDMPQVRDCLAAFRAPSPALAAGPALATGGATSMMDVSDGLLRDAGRIARASGVVIGLDDPDDLPDTSFLEPVAALVADDAGPAARALARPDSKRMALIGNGAQSEFQALAFHTQLGIEEIAVYDVDPDATEKLIRNLAEYSDLKIIRANSTAEAVKGADIITTVTADKTYATIITPDMLEPGMHINGVGGDCPGKTELHADVLRAGRVFVEYEPQSRIEGDIQQLPADFPVVDLWKVLAGTEEGRQDKDQITIFDSVGFALEDYSTLRYVYQQALLRDIGVDIELVPDGDDPKNLFRFVRGGRGRAQMRRVA